MKRIDVIILAALLVAVAGSALGVVTYEDSRGSQFRVTWGSLAEIVEAEPQSLTGDGQVELVADVPFGNVTGGNVTVEITSTPGALAPLAVHIELLAPGASEPIVMDGSMPTASTSVSFDLSILLASPPNATTIRASSPEDAAQQVASSSTSDAGRGNWTIAVSIAATVPDPLGAVQHTVGAILELDSYRPEIVPLVPEVQR